MVFDKPSGHLAVPGRGADKQDCLTVQGPDELTRRIKALAKQVAGGSRNTVSTS